MGEILKSMGIPYAMIRPTLVIGNGDLLANKMAWPQRRFPVFPVFRNGDCRVQPVNAIDVAARAVGAGSPGDCFVADAAGPDTFTLEELYKLLATAAGSRVRFVQTHPTVGCSMTKLVGLALRDVVFTWDEVRSR